MHEKEIMQKLVKALKLTDGFCIKFTFLGVYGASDRLVILPKDLYG